MDENNPLFVWIRENISGPVAFIGGVILAIMPILGKAVIDRFTGKQRSDTDASAASVAQSLIGATQELADLSAQLSEKTAQLYEAKLLDSDAKYRQLEVENVRIKQLARRELEKEKHLMREAIAKIEKQKEKLQAQLDKVSKELVQVRTEAEAWRNQIIQEFNGTPTRVPLIPKDQK